MMYPTLTVSQEFVNLDFASDAIQQLPDFKRIVTNFIRDPFFKGYDNPFDSLPQRKMEKTLKAFPFVQYVDYVVWVPEGMVSGYTPMLKDLGACIQQCQTIQDSTLTPMQQWLGVVLADPSRLQSVRRQTDVKHFVPVNVSYYAEQLGQHFNPQNKEVRQPLGKVFTNNQDILSVLSTTNDHIEQFTSIDRRQLIRQTETITQLLDTLHDRANSGDEAYRFSKENLSLVAHMCREMAQTLEFYAMTAYMLQQTNTALSDNCVRLSKLKY